MEGSPATETKPEETTNSTGGNVVSELNPPTKTEKSPTSSPAPSSTPQTAPSPSEPAPAAKGKSEVAPSVASIAAKKKKAKKARRGAPVPLPDMDAPTVKLITLEEKTIQIPRMHTETTQDLKAFLYEFSDTCYMTHYSLQLDSKPISDFASSEEYQLQDDSVWKMIKVPYDEGSARLHVRRLREILELSTPEATNLSPSVFSQITFDHLQNPQQAQKQSKENTNGDKSSTSELLLYEDLLGGKVSSKHYFPKIRRKPPLCVKSIIFSGWNPVPGYRRLQGDLFYLEIETLENHTHYITCSVQGFFVNSSTQSTFNPSPSHPLEAESNQPSYTLIELLNKLSPTFKTHFPILISKYIDQYHYEILPVSQSIFPWFTKSNPHTYNLNRGLETSFAFKSDTEQLRDWNEEFQSCRELPTNSVQERIVRDLALVKVHDEFIEAATKGAMAVVHKALPPLNPIDPPSMHMYIMNNIFFSFATDARELFKDVGGEAAAFAAANNDLKGISAINSLNISGLYTLLTAVIDYRGYRVVAQSIIPGILHREQTSQVVYGSLDMGKTIKYDEKFHDLLKKASTLLHISDRTLVDDETKSFTLCAPLDIKGIVGTDGRHYVLDLVRMTPRDANFPEKKDYSKILRPELISKYCGYLKQKKEIENEIKKQEEQEKGKEPEKGEAEKKTETEIEKKAETEAEKKGDTSSEKDGTTETKKPENEEPEENTLFNTDVFATERLVASDQLKKDEEEVRQLSTFLKDIIIPSMLKDIIDRTVVPLDGISLTQIMHSSGINMRYLGWVTQQSKPLTWLYRICENELINRCAKAVFNEFLRNLNDEAQLAAACAHFLNLLFSGSTATATKGKNKKKTSEKFGMTSTKLWNSIFAKATEKYQYDLKASFKSENYASLSSLRGFARHVGLQILTRDYNFQQNDNIFQESDIFGLFPLVKHSEPLSMDAQELLEVGKGYLLHGRLELAFRCFNEALAILHQIYGPMNKRTCQCYTHLGWVLHHFGDHGQAIGYQEKAVVINERVQGLDHCDTIEAYTNLGLFCQKAGNIEAAITFLERALYLSNIAFSYNHPDHATAYINIGMLLQELVNQKKKAKLTPETVMTKSIEYLEKGLKISDEVSSFFNSLFPSLSSFPFGQPSAPLTNHSNEASPSSSSSDHQHSHSHSHSHPHSHPHPHPHPTSESQTGQPDNLTSIADGLGGALSPAALAASLQNQLALPLRADPLTYATICHSIAVGYGALDRYRDAMKYQRQNYLMLSKYLGNDDPRTQESNIWLKQWTAKAVAQETETKQRKEAEKSGQVTQQPAQPAEQSPVNSQNKKRSKRKNK